MFANQVEDVLVFLVYEPCDRLIDQLVPVLAKHSGGGKVNLQDQPFIGDEAITYRRQIIEIEIASPRGFQFRL